MRVTTKQMADGFAADLFRQTENLYRAQERLATQKKINRPSDDPVGIGKVLDYRTALSSIEQYQRNISQAMTHAETTETILDAVDDLLVQARETAAEHATGAGEFATLQLAAEEIDDIRDQIFGLANSKLGGRYLFAGRASDSPAFVADAGGTITYDGDLSAGGDARYIIGEGVTAAVAANGEEIFNGSEDVFVLLADLRDELQAADPDADVIGDLQSRLQGVIDKERAVRAGNATVYQRLEATAGQLDRLELNLDNLRGREEDVDMAQAAVALKALETIYEASLATAAKIMQPSLVDFLG